MPGFSLEGFKQAAFPPDKPRASQYRAIAKQKFGWSDEEFTAWKAKNLEGDPNVLDDEGLAKMARYATTPLVEGFKHTTPVDALAAAAVIGSAGSSLPAAIAARSILPVVKAVGGTVGAIGGGYAGSALLEPVAEEAEIRGHPKTATGIRAANILIPGHMAGKGATSLLSRLKQRGAPTQPVAAPPPPTPPPPPPQAQTVQTLPKSVSSKSIPKKALKKKVK